MVEVVEVDVTEVVDSVAAEVEDAAEVSDTEYPSVHRLMGLIKVAGRRLHLFQCSSSWR
jgi:hypothetical protein